MKNIFKKLHKGSSSSSSSSGVQDPNRSNEASSQSLSINCALDSGTNSGPSPTTPTPPITFAVTPTPITSVSDRTDYFSSEEEFQLQLALAISASNSEYREDRDKDQIRAATSISLDRNRIDFRKEGNESAESLSRQYWDFNFLDYMEKVVDGFYDLYGLSTDPATQGKMPSLADIQTDCGNSSFEVVIVNRTIDPALVELEQIAYCIALDCPSNNVGLLVQRIADLVTEHMGGPVRDANMMLARWMERIMDLQTSLQSCILPIGSLNFGLSRHRALLFKVLADNVGVPCRLVKGSHYTGIEDDAVNIIKLENEREFLVDLMAAPGTLIPADSLTTNDASVNPYNPRLSETLISWATQESGVGLSKEEALLGAYNEGNRKPTIDNGIILNKKSSFEKADSVPCASTASNGLSFVSVENSSNESPNSVISVKHLPLLSSSHYKGNEEGSSVEDVLRERYTVPPSQQDIVNSEALFADLNPFQMVGAGNRSVKNKLTENNENDFVRQKETLAMGPGRPPLPLVWKNRSPWNEVPRTKQYGFVEGPPKKSQEDRDYNTSIASSSSGTSEKHYPNANGAEPSGISRAARKGARESSSDFENSMLRLCTNQHDKLHFKEAGKQTSSVPCQDKGHQQRGGEVLQNDIVDETKECGNYLGKHDHRKYTRDKFTGTRLGAVDPKDRSSVISAPIRPDAMLDDVAELEIPWEDLCIGERIGLGSYGEVYRADWNGMEVAVKKFLDQDFYGDALDEFRSEVRIMRRLRHPNVVHFVGAVTRPPNLSIVTEFLPRGSLYRILHRPNCHIDEKRRIRMALDVAMGMNCLHISIPTIVHRDLKSLNLLVDDSWNVKVCDFGLSRLKHNTFLSSKSTAGTPEWMAPEVLRNEPSNEKCDVYSFGVILWELATLRLPWSGMNQMQVVGAVGFQNRRLDIPKELDPLVATIIRECWQTDPNLRPSFSQLTAALQSLQRLVIPSHQDHENLPLSTEISNGLDTKVEKSRKQMKERKNRALKIRGVKKTKAGDAAKGGKKK
ncbi:Serine/threonine-protein kinase EDR1 [Thalictrum thalictroides]|uniref:non-specific serine/threonine protein kinase n=1 Tax=Thalictrum thalictroides TaxID=46969 RepID=A0A7J6WKU8_THATH|nr:Serine/threonine-protein kinase EDR1 [Thalictrum thalictroides]